MKKFFLTMSFAVATLALQAQGLLVQMGNVTYAYPYDETTTMDFDGTTLTINGFDFDVTQIDQIVGTSETIEPQQVTVAYNSTSATARISGDLAGRVAATISGADVSVTDNVVKETETQEFPEVTYVLSGASSEGSFQLNGSYKSTVSLNGVSLESSACPMEILNGKRIDIQLVEGTQNTFKDGTNNLRKSAFFVKGHAEFTGAGVLNITGSVRHAYSSNEYTLLKNSFTGTINILSAAGDAMHVEQYFEQRNGNIVMQNMLGDGLDVSVTQDPTDINNGQLFISGGTLKATVTADDTKGVKCDSTATISGGQITLINSGDGSKGMSVGGSLLVQQDPLEGANVRPYIFLESTGDEYTDPVTSETSKCRGIKVKGDFTFNGGTIERGANSTIKKSKMIGVDGTYTYISGVFKEISM